MLRRATTSIILVLLGTSAPAWTQEICVTCAGPDAVYRCTIEKSEKITSRLGNLAEKPIKELARLGGHNRCAVRREAANAPCPGIEKQLSLSSLLENLPGQKPAPATGAEAQPVSTPPPQSAPPANPEAGPPKTMEELAKRTGTQSKEQLKGVGNAASKSWECLTSLFTKC